MKIGIIGSGNVGGVLGTRWAMGGHEVVFASRKPDSDEMKKLTAGATGSRSASIADTVSASDVVLLSTPWPATQEIVSSCGNLSGKILIDATNPIARDFSGLDTGTTTSGAEKVASWAPGARVVKAFNTVGNNIMANSKFDAGPVALFYCGDDVGAKSATRSLAVELGFDAVDAGPLTQARLLEPFAMLWITLALKQGLGREIGFRLLKR